MYYHLNVYCAVFMTYLDPDEVRTWEELGEGYSAMARDAAREREAEEWSEGLITDASAEA
jgi:hypothetical protein